MFEVVSEILYCLTQIEACVLYNGDISMALGIGIGMARRCYETISMTPSSFIQCLATISRHHGILRTRKLLTDRWKFSHKWLAPFTISST